MNSTFDIEKDFFFDSIWNPSSSRFQKYGRKYLRRVEMFDYKLKSQNETVTIYEYKGTISKKERNTMKVSAIDRPIVRHCPKLQPHFTSGGRSTKKQRDNTSNSAAQRLKHTIK